MIRHMDPTDSFAIFFDNPVRSGDPDICDRYFQLARDGAQLIGAGRGGNSDGLIWDTNYTSEAWTAVVGEADANRWLVELAIDAATEMPGMTSAFGFMARVLFTGEGAARRFSRSRQSPTTPERGARSPTPRAPPGDAPR